MNERFETKKSLGQHFLNSPLVPQWMCDAAELSAGELVVEVGPGTGALTREILARGARVVALEADRRAIAVLEDSFPEEVASGQLTLHCVDMRTFDLATLALPDGGYKVVANIPYYLSGFLLRTFLEHAAQPQMIVFLIQKEVAKRITSSLKRNEKESLLSLSVKCYGTPTYVRTVTRGHFTPPPKVDSAIVAVGDISRERLDGLDAQAFFHVLHLGFGKKRKQLLGNLAAEYPRPELTHIFSTLSLPLTVRAEDIDLATWRALVKKLVGIGSAV
ncbi:MAG: 16S rRNA (adenine(1518)-N(6)/adenine(1519)-N(6))-dimethyltransferase RsmA [Candidatus Paceibacterota bacterium]